MGYTHTNPPPDNLGGRVYYRDIYLNPPGILMYQFHPHPHHSQSPHYRGLMLYRDYCINIYLNLPGMLLYPFHPHPHHQQNLLHTHRHLRNYYHLGDNCLPALGYIHWGSCHRHYLNNHCLHLPELD